MSLSTIAPVRVSATAAAVREFAAANGIKTGARGRLNPEAIAAFNKGRVASNRYTEGAVQPKSVATITGKNDKGRKVTKTVDVTKAREAAREQGFEVGARGRLSDEILLAVTGLTACEPKAVKVETEAVETVSE